MGQLLLKAKTAQEIEKGEVKELSLAPAVREWKGCSNIAFLAMGAEKIFLVKP